MLGPPQQARRIGLGVAAGALVAAALVLVLARGRGDVGVVHRGDPVFNVRRPVGLPQVRVHGRELLRLERRAGGRLLESFSVEPMTLPAYTGNVGGVLPLYAERELAAVRARHPGFRLVQEAKTRINDAAGYTVAFRASGNPRLYGRLTLLPEPVAGARRGVRLLVYATPAAGASGALYVGARGDTKLPYRSFRFGTEPP